MKKVNDNNKENYGSFYSLISTFNYVHLCVLEDICYIGNEFLFVDSKNSPHKNKYQTYRLTNILTSFRLPKNYLKRIKKRIKRIYEKFTIRKY